MMKVESANSKFIRDYTKLRDALKEIQQEFENGARLLPNLYWEKFFMLRQPVSLRGWEGFIATNRFEDDTFWEHWECDAFGCYHIFGEQPWFEHFRGLAESGFLILNEIKWLFGELPAIPHKCELYLPSVGGYAGWIDLLTDSAIASTPFLRLKEEIWHYPDTYDGDLDDLQNSTWKEPADGGDPFPMHPFCTSLHGNLFRSSVEAIRIWLQPDCVANIGDFDDNVPIFLPLPENIRWKSTEASENTQQSIDLVNLKPHYDPPAGEGRPCPYGRLTLNEKLIYEFSQDASAQTPILESFQNEGWPPEIASPLHKNIKSREERKQAHHDLSQALTKMRKWANGYLTFKADRGFIKWRLLENQK
jgi:hypothetical protein